MTNDAELLREYVESQSDAAFAELVGRHFNLVYSTAFRMVREAALARDISQSVFIQLARKASTVRDGNALPGWLYQVTHCQAANALRAERTRRQREGDAMMQAQLDTNTAWEYIGSGLEEAMRTLSLAEQNLIVMRFFEEQSWREVGNVLALSEDTVQRRAARALEKLRAHFARRGITATASLIGLTIAANAVQAAPVGLASTVATAALTGAAGSGSFNLLTVIKTILVKKSTYALLTAAIVVGVSIPLMVAKVNSARDPVTEDGLRKGLILHFTFDQDAPDGKVADASGQGNNGHVAGVRWTADGKKGGAYEFTADGDEIVVPNNASLNPKQLTLAAWIKTSYTDAKWRRIFDKSYGNGYAVSIAADWQQNKWRGLASLELGPGPHFNLTQSMVADGRWHQVVATFNGTEQILYMDGKPDGNPLWWDKPGQVGANDFNLVIGCNRSNLKEDDLGVSFRGLIDEPMMWNRALSPKEVAFLFESQR